MATTQEHEEHEEEEEEEQVHHQPHAFVLPFPGLGHVNPILHFAHRLASRNLLVTFVYSSRVYHRLRLHQPNFHQREEREEKQRQFFRVKVVYDGLPTDENYTPTVDEFRASLHLIQKGMEELLEESFMDESDDHPVSCIISDTFFSWAKELAQKFRLPTASIWCASAGVYSIGKHIPLLISEGFIPYKGQNDMIRCIPGLLPMPASDLPKPFLVQDMSDPFFQMILKAFQADNQAHWILFNTVYELESCVVDSLRAAQTLAVYTIGPLIPCDIHETSTFTGNETCLKWLDSQVPLSVIYIAFGSTASLSDTEVHVLAKALKRSHQPFLWALRSTSLMHLPEAFPSETEGQGLVVPWVPQLQVLSHCSVGGFISHCGWNSIMESFYTGVPIIGWPKRAEQHTNLKFITEIWKVGVPMEGWGEGEGRTISIEGVERTVRALMQGEEGRAARNRMAEMRKALKAAMAEGGSSNRDMEKFIADMRRRKAQQQAARSRD